MYGFSTELITKINWPSNLFTVANLPLVINYVDKPNIRIYWLLFYVQVVGETTNAIIYHPQ